MNWRELLAEPEGTATKSNIRNNSKTPVMESCKGGFADIATIAQASRPLELPPDDVVKVFIREYQRLGKRISRVMDSDLDRGYLAWTRQNAPELWRSLENARGEWDVNERLEELKAGRIAWRDYRALMLAWARLNLRAIRHHRLELKKRTAP